MSDPTIHGRRPVFSASKVLEAVAESLTKIKAEDGLTDADIARVLGKSDDQAAKYRTGLAEMGIVAFASAKREWNGRFTGQFDRLCVDSRPSSDGDHARQSKVLAAALALSKAMEGSGEISPSEVRDNRSTIEDARDALDDLLRKIVRIA